MKIIYILTLILFVCTSCSKEFSPLTSPDRQLEVAFSLDSKGIPFYTVLYKQDTLIYPSRMGVEIKDAPMDSALTVVSQTMLYDQTPFYADDSLRPDQENVYNELVVKVRRDKQEMDIIVRAYNEGVAIRYWLRGYENIVIQGDLTEMRFQGNEECFWAYQEGNDPHPKNDYYRSTLREIQTAFREQPMDEAQQTVYPDSCYLSFPFLMKTESGKYLNFQRVSSFGESSYAMRIHPTGPALYSHVMNGGMSEQVVTLPYSTQWLSIGVASSAGRLLQSELVYHLSNEEEVPREPEHHPIRLYNNNCYNNVILPFSRHYEGKREYPLLHIDKGAYSTWSHQLALHVVFNRPLSVYRDYRDSVPGKQLRAYQFLNALPRAWGKMHVLGSELGKYVVVARQDAASSDWFVGGITDGTAREMRVTFDFLDEEKLYKGTFYEDTPNSDWLENPRAYQSSSVYIRKNNTFHFRMGCGGGFALQLQEVKIP